MKRTVAALLVLLCAATAQAQNFTQTIGDTVFARFTTGTDPNNAANFSTGFQPVCDAVVSTFTTAFANAAATPNRAAAGDLYQCRDATSTPGTPGCTRVQQFPTLGSFIVPAMRAFKMQKGQFFRFDVTTAPGGGSEAVIALTCVRSLGDTSTAYYYNGEILHYTINPNEAFQLPANPYRTALIIANLPSSGEALWWANEDGGLGDSILTTAEIGTPIFPGQTVVISAEEGANMRSSVGMDTQGTGTIALRVWEAARIPIEARQ